MCTSSVQQLNENSIEFFLLTQTRNSSKVSQSKFLYQNSVPSLALFIVEPCHFLFSYLPQYLSDTTQDHYDIARP